MGTSRAMTLDATSVDETTGMALIVAGVFMRIAAGRRSKFLLSASTCGDERPVMDGRGSQQDVECLGRGEPVVLIPGIAGGRGLVSPLARRLAKRHRVIVPSLRGDRGVLGLDPAREIADHADDLATTLDRLGLERPTLLGVSFGGAVALEYAVSHPDRVGGLVLWGVESKFRPTVGMAIARRALERFPLPTDSPFLNQFFNLLHGRKPEPGPLVDFIVEQSWRTDQAVVAHRLAMLEGFDVADRLWRVDAPTLVLAGSRDVVVPPARQKALAEQISGAVFAQVEGAGHVGFLTHREELVSRLVGLVDRVRGQYC